MEYTQVMYDMGLAGGIYSFHPNFLEFCSHLLPKADALLVPTIRQAQPLQAEGMAVVVLVEAKEGGVGGLCALA